MGVNWLEVGEQFAIAHPELGSDFMRKQLLDTEAPLELIELTLKGSPWGQTERDWTCWAMAVVLAQSSSKDRIAKMMHKFAKELSEKGLLSWEFGPMMELLQTFSSGADNRKLRDEARRLARQYQREAEIQLALKCLDLRTLMLAAASCSMKSMQATDIARAAEEAAGFLKAFAHAQSLDENVPIFEQVNQFLYADAVPAIELAISPE